MAPAAAARAVHLLGKQGLRELALVTGRRLRIAEGVEQIPGCVVVAPKRRWYVPGDTGAPEGPDVRIVSDEAHRLGWSLGPARPAGRTDQTST